MDLESLQKFAVANFSQYFSATVDTLVRPGLHFAPIAVDASGQEVSVPSGSVGSRLNPRLAGFAVLSMFLGLTMNSLITKRPEGKELYAIEVIGLLFWAVYASLVHLFCKLVRGRGSFLESVSVTIQIFATLYVVCSSISAAMAMVILMKPVKSFVSGLGGLGEMVAENPVTLFFLVHTVLLMIYLPRGLKHVHGFNLLQQIGVAVPTGCVVLLHGVAMLALTGTIWSADPSPITAKTRGFAAPVAACHARAAAQTARASRNTHLVEAA